MGTGQVNFLIFFLFTFVDNSIVNVVSASACDGHEPDTSSRGKSPE